MIISTDSKENKTNKDGTSLMVVPLGDQLGVKQQNGFGVREEEALLPVSSAL